MKTASEYLDLDTKYFRENGFLGRNGHKEPSESSKERKIERLNIPERADVNWATGRRHKDCNGHVIKIFDERAVDPCINLCDKCGKVNPECYLDPEPSEIEEEA